MKKKHILTLLIAALLTIFIGAAPSKAAPQRQTNLLSNAGFEQPYDGDGSAGSWGRWFRDSGTKPADCAEEYHLRPSWGAATDIVKEGSVSQYVGNNWDTWAAGVFQTVNVTPGTTYRFSFWGRGRGGNDPLPAPSESGLNMQMRAGVDLTGSGNWTNVTVEGGYGSPHDQWQEFSVEFTATGNAVTVFTMSDWGIAGVNQCRKFMSTYYDGAQLVEVGPPPTATSPPLPTAPPATSAPVATNTPAATNTPVATATNTPVPTITPSPTPEGGEICLNAFADDNRNGVHDAGEGYMAGVTFTVASTEKVMGQGVSTGMEQPVCFQGLPANQYQVSQLIPPRLEMTTAANTMLTLNAGATLGVEFGSTVRSAESVATAVTEIQATLTPDTTPEEGGDGGGGGNLLAYIGLGAIGLGILALLGVVIVILKK